MAEVTRIYVVDDETMIATTLSLILNRNGFDTESFSSAEEAWERIQHLQPDVLLSDVLLIGDLTGIELTERVLATFPSVRCLLMSGHIGTSEVLKMARARGFNYAIIAKPFAPGELLNQIAKLLTPES